LKEYGVGEEVTELLRKHDIAMKLKQRKQSAANRGSE